MLMLSPIIKRPGIVIPPHVNSINAASSVNGGVATVQGTFTQGPITWAAANAIDGSESEANWANGGGWIDDTSLDAGARWFRIDFSGTHKINEIDVITTGGGATPTLSSTIDSFGLTDYSIEYWDGSAWVEIDSVTANDKAWRQFQFNPIITSTIRVLMTGTDAPDGLARLVEVEAWSVGVVEQPPENTDVSINIALASRGATATASSSQDYPVGASFYKAANVINGSYTDGAWCPLSASSTTDYVQIMFAGAQSINAIHVFSIMDSSAGVDANGKPLATTTFTKYGCTAATLSYTQNGSTWTTIGSYSGNNLVWKAVTFTAVTATGIRVTPTGSIDGFPRITEIEVYTSGAPANFSPSVRIVSPTSGNTFTQPANITFHISATDPDGTIAQVELFKDGASTPIATITQGNQGDYSYTDNNVAAGSHTYIAKGTDDKGAITASATLPITVNAVATPVVSVSTRVQVSEASNDGPTWFYANTNLKYAWNVAGGDYRDKNNVRWGSTHYASSVIATSNEQTLTITGLADLATRLISDNTGIYLYQSGGTDFRIWTKENTAGQPKPVFTVVTSTGTFTPALTHDLELNISTNQTVGTIGTANQRVILKFDMSGVTGTVSSASLTLRIQSTTGQTLYVNWLEMPVLVTDPVKQLGGATTGLRATLSESALASHADVIFYDPMTAAVTPTLWSNYNPTGYQHQGFKTWSEFGVSAQRLASLGGNTTGIGDSITPYLAVTIASWKKTTATKYDELYGAYTLMIDPDVKIGMNESGVKLPIGFGSSLVDTTAEYFALRLRHDAKSAAHPDVYRLVTYFYDVDSPISNPDRGRVETTSVCLRAGKIYTIEQRVKVNTRNAVTGVWNRDGIVEIWVDDVLVYQKTSMMLTQDPNIKIDRWEMIIFHGGNTAPSATIHYEVGPYVIAKQRIGALKAPQPTWLTNITQINKLTDIPNTTFNASGAGGYAVWTANAYYKGIWYAPCPGGHNDAFPFGLVTAIDFNQNVPVWRTISPKTATADIPKYSQGSGAGLLVSNTIGCHHFYDGRPSSNHSYYSAHVVPSRNRLWHYQHSYWSADTHEAVIPPTYNLATNEWDFIGHWNGTREDFNNGVNVSWVYENLIYQPGQVPLGVQGCSAIHPTLDIIYQGFYNSGNSTWGMGRWLPSGVFQMMIWEPSAIWNNNGSCVDPVRNLWVKVGAGTGADSSGHYIGRINIGANGLGATLLTPLTVTGISAQPTWESGGTGMCYDSDNDRYLVTSSSGRIYEIHPDTGAATILHGVDQNPVNAILGRTAYSKEFGCYFYSGSGTENVRVIRRR